MNGDNVIYFDSLTVDFKKFKKIHTTKISEKNIYKIQTNDAIMCGYFCIGFAINRDEYKSTGTHQIPF